MEGNPMFDVGLILQGTKEIHRSLLPFLPRAQDQIELEGKIYIVGKIVYDLSAYRHGSGSVIPTKVYVRRKTDNDY